MKVNLSLTIEKKTHEEIKATIPPGEVSSLVDNLLKEYLKKVREKKLITVFKRMNENKQLQNELTSLEQATTEDISKKLTNE